MTNVLKQLNELGRAAMVDAQAAKDWSVEVPRPCSVHGFDVSAAPRVIAGWLAHAALWVPRRAEGRNLKDLERQFAAMLGAKKFAPQLTAQWEALMQLVRDGSSFAPVPWAWWRWTEAPEMSPWAIFHPKVIAEPWQRKKLWTAHPETFSPRVRLYPAAAVQAARLEQLRLRGAPPPDPSTTAWLDATCHEQRTKVALAVQAAWRNSNLVLWLGDDATLLRELRITKLAVTTLG